MPDGYASAVWNARYFWLHLTLADLRSRWRGSFFGILWTLIQPVGTTLLLSLVFSKIFHTPIREYAPYILSGMVVWDFAIASSTAGSLSFVQADAYIRQCKQPLAIYTLRTVLTNLVVLSLASMGLIVWVLVAMPEMFGWSWLAALAIFPLLLLIGWPLATVLAYFATRFRDLPYALALVFQAMWFVSPIYFKVETFRSGGLNALVDYNPIYHLLQIVRAPLLQGAWPTWENYAWSLGLAVALSLIAVIVGSRVEKTMIFYL